MDCLVLNGGDSGPVGIALPRSLSPKMDDTAREDACREYQSSLEDLTFNSKPHINMLTILAEENLHFAKDIVAIIEAQISKAPAAEKLPLLYLVDSIVKNVGGEYLAVFAKNLITSFICVFEKVEENTRKSLFKLRSTWDDVFPLKKLYALDARVNSVDQAWPIKPLPPTVNASIHVNPKFLKQPEEATSPRAAAPPPPQPPTPAPQPAPAVTPSSVTQEQLIRQQLLAKQKQLLELQQKKIELELEQTKAQLVGETSTSSDLRPHRAPPLSTSQPAGGFVLPSSNPAPVPPPAPQTSVPQPASQTTPVIRPWIPPQPETKPPTRDPRLNRTGPAAPPQLKEQPTMKKESPTVAGPAHMAEKRQMEKTIRLEKGKAQRREVEEKCTSKSPSPMLKGGQNKSKHIETENLKAPDATKKDPRLRKRTQDKGGEAKEDELKEKKRCTDKKEREEAARASEPQRSTKGKPVNGSVSKHREESIEKTDFKSGGNARTHARKRTRSRSRSRSPASSPKRKDRRSPKGRTRSASPSPSPSHKPSKARRAREGEPQHVKPSREDRLLPKKNLSESRRSKRPADDRHSESRDSHSPRGHDSKEAKEPPHRWRSGWEENKIPKLSEESHPKPGPQRHKAYSAPTRPSTPRTPKHHRLSVDANLQIPEALNSASKRDLLRRASKRLESGEMSQEEFLNMAHQIKHFFQYQEEKRERSESWEDPSDPQQPHGPNKKQPLLDTPTSAQAPRPNNDLDEAELTYYEHKSKLRKTQVIHRATEEWEGGQSPEEGESAVHGGKPSGRSLTHPPSHKYSRTPRDREGETRSKEREDPRPQPGSAPMIEEYNHGKEFPPLKSLPGLRFRRRADPRESSEREWNSPLTERNRHADREEQKSGYDTPRRQGPPADSRNPDPRRPERPPSAAPVVHRKCPSPTSLDPPARHSPVSAFERERLSPLQQKETSEMSPVPRFESPTSEHSDDGPINLEAPPSHPHPSVKSILKMPVRGGPLSSVRQHSDSPGHTPPHEAGLPPARFDKPAKVSASRPHPPGRYEGGGPGPYDESSRYDGPHHQGPGRFEGGAAPLHNMPERFDGPGRFDSPPMPHGSRFEGPPHPQGSGRFDGPVGQQPAVRFDGAGPRPGHFEGPISRFEAPRHFDNSMGPGPGAGPMGFQPQHPMHFEGPPNQMGPMRFEGSGPMRFEGPQSGPRFDLPNLSHQGPPRFGPQHGLQQSMRSTPYDGPTPPQHGFMAPQAFQEPMNPQFSSGPMGFQAQASLPQGGGFSMQAAPFGQTGPGPFYGTAGPNVGMQQSVNMMATLSQAFPVPFRQTGQVVPPESHFGQVDVNDLLTKLISTGIIKPSQPDATPATDTESSSSAAAPVAPVPVAAAAAAAAVEEEEEEEQEEEDDDIPDLTGFVIDDMKQRYESVVTKLYTGNQCCSCGMRFTSAQTDLFADHLDWHYRQNNSMKDASKKIIHRRWYYTLTDWIEFEEIADLEERAKSHFFEKENEEEVQKSQEAAKEKKVQSVRATNNVVGESCEICQEAFETFWEEEEEDWHLKNAIRVDETAYHPSCYEDYKNTSLSLDVTPSPVKAPTEHPLSAFIKKEEEEVEEEATSCLFASVKQEVEAEGIEPPTEKKEEEPVPEEGATGPSAVS
ncbi:pre-mRNA cleavage complex 2 protein Pcf11 isoform X2 [Genypterus blacodes]|uniref:pre-mRNA cleavage complex 2 protein Pcf11 isoform X2 n=1 Tax=Genypterus blacodes TaxID=154954 RepID=UPI003F772986